MLVSKTYAIVTDGSTVIGDCIETGFLYENEEMDLEEAIREIENGGFVEWSSSDPVNGDWISTVDDEIDYSTGDCTSYSLHFKCTDKEFAVIVESLDAK